jgi:hypothetical protein
METKFVLSNQVDVSKKIQKLKIFKSCPEISDLKKSIFRKFISCSKILELKGNLESILNKFRVFFLKVRGFIRVMEALVHNRL